MIAYIDSSVLLRIAFGEPDRLPELERVEVGVTSQLARVECLRTIDRSRIRSNLSGESVVRLHERVAALLRRMKLVSLAPAILKRAAQPFATNLGTLDALHLATALVWQESEGRPLDALMTHDLELAHAARTSGFKVFGCD